MAVLLSNNATSTLAGSITSGVTQLTINGADAAKFPAPGAGQWFPVTLIDTNTGNMEVVRCTTRAGSVLTIVRAQEGTTAKAFPAGARVDCRLTAAVIAEIVADVLTLAQSKLDAASYTAQDVLNKLLTVDGPGSGLNADLLDGISSATFARQDQYNFFTDGQQIATPGALNTQRFALTVTNNSYLRYTWGIESNNNPVLWTYNTTGVWTGSFEFRPNGTIWSTSGGTHWNTGNFNPDTKANIAGDTFTGRVIVQGTPGSGGVRLDSGDANFTGFVSFHDASGVRAGYIGYANSSTINLSAENGRNFNFSINPTIGTLANIHDANSPWPRLAFAGNVTATSTAPAWTYVEHYAGAVVTGIMNMQPGSTNNVNGVRYRYLQARGSDGNYYTVSYV